MNRKDRDRIKLPHECSARSDRHGFPLRSLIVLVAAANAAFVAADEVVLWNKLGSVAEVLHSEVGPGGTIHGSEYAFEPAQFGLGYVRKATGPNYVSFPGALLGQVTHRGTVEVWINPKVPRPVPFEYGIFDLVCGPYGADGNIMLTWGDGVSGQGLMGDVVFRLDRSDEAYTGPEAQQFVAAPGVPFHAALCWDIQGIAGTTDTVRVYRDGELVNRSTMRWDPSGTDRRDIILGFSPDGQGQDKFITDNIVLWNYAKTVFTDRFLEAPGLRVSAPVSQVSCLGQSVAFAVAASGLPPFTYQWFFNGAAIAGQTDSTLMLTRLQTGQSGSYWVEVTDASGRRCTSEPAALIVGDACVDLHLYAGMNITGESGRTYELCYTTDLRNTSLSTWTALATNVMSDSGWFYVDPASASSPRRFYGVRLLR